ncbi:hybrid sensor histidine kinase/response regulator transcription factor [Maribellus sediminis]|uniref:hybrid sensor histidine kinase/response regulator transcription factor n=1 Tax=Maribellus sediminis TaxID=2696285 RepID=UPI0014317869|nr:hybrid sensor histidine kinase/response regulator transcription factor [Maribellus sediminis]
MRKIKHLLLIAIFFLGTPTFIHGNDTISFSASPSDNFSELYILSDGFATLHIDQVFVDAKGRMWINPRVDDAKNLRLSFFEYDGTQSFFYELKPNWFNEENVVQCWYLLGLTPDGFLLGANRENNILFYWHPDTQEQYFFKLENGLTLLNMVSDLKGGILVLMLNEEINTYTVSRLYQDTKEDIASIQLHFDDPIRLHYDDPKKIATTPGSLTYPFEIKGDWAWFFHERKGLVKLNLINKTIFFTPWSEFENIPLIQKIESDVPQFHQKEFVWKIIDKNSDELLLYLGQQNGFFNLNNNSHKLSVETQLNTLMLKGGGENPVLDVYFAKDLENNLLIVSGYFDPWIPSKKITNLQAVLMDKKGNWLNYTSLLRKMVDTSTYTDFWYQGKFFSADYSQEIGSTLTDKGMKLLSLTPDLEIKTINYSENYKLRSMLQLDSTNLLINSAPQVFRLRQLNETLETNSSHRVLVVHEKGTHRPNSGRLINNGYHIQTRAYSSVVRSNGKIWMSARFNLVNRTGLQWYDPVRDTTDHIPTEIFFEKFAFINDKEVALFEDNGDYTNIGDLHIFNIETKTMRPFLYEDIPFTVGAKVNDIYQPEDSILWLGAQNGLWQIDFKSGKVQQYNQDENFKNANIICINEASDSLLWLGSGNSGIFILNKSNNSVRQITIAGGLSNNTVAGILSDDQLNRWVSTSDGITVLNSKGKILFYLKELDGLCSNQFNENSCVKLYDGRMVFGSDACLSILHPNHILQTLAKRESEKIYLTGLKYYDNKKKEDVVRQGSYTTTDFLQIPAAHNYINLDFAISSYINLQEQTYSYRLLPFSESNKQDASIDWINLGAESQVTINNLPPGEFIVQVRGADEHSIQVDAPLEIPIYVHDLFYRTWWFYLLSAFSAFMIAFIWIRRIISEKTRLEREVERRTLQIQIDKAIIERQAEKLKELDQAKSRFFTNISHEFRTPLTVILGMAGQIKEQTRIRKLIQRNAQVLLRLINQILELRKLETVGLEAQMIQGDIVAFIRNITESFHSLADDRGVSLQFEPQHVELVLDFDSEKLLHIISNLLTNAVKFTPDGGEVKIIVESPKDKDASVFLISVSDTGAGIPEEKLPHIFDRFYQVDDELSRTGSGTGIGLALVKELVKLLGGEISVESKLNKGTTFKVQLPYTQNAELAEDTREVNPNFIEVDEELADHVAVETVDGKELPTLLIVEDNRDVAEYLSTCLEEKYNLFYAVNGQEGIDMAIEHVPDIILSDVMMPKVDGFTLCNTLKTDIKTSHIPIVLLTAKADIDSRILGLQRGADAYLAKPFNEKELEVQLQNLLQIRIQLQQRYANTDNLEPSEDIAIQQEDQFVIRVREAILENMDQENFGVPELCKILFMSRTQLHNKLKSLTDKSTSHFIRFIRLEKACQLLRESDLNISQVSLEVGIESFPYFSRIFTEHTGLSPNKYREKYH